MRKIIALIMAVGAVSVGTTSISKADFVVVIHGSQGTKVVNEVASVIVIHGSYTKHIVDPGYGGNDVHLLRGSPGSRLHGVHPLHRSHSNWSSQEQGFQRRPATSIRPIKWSSKSQGFQRRPATSIRPKKWSSKSRGFQRRSFGAGRYRIK